MTIEELKRAYESGETIQFKLDGKGWVDWDNQKFGCFPCEYRIKPRYRPFKDCDELIATWREMIGYPAKANTMPLIWAKYKYNEHDVSFFINGFDKTDNSIRCNDEWIDFQESLEILTFLDGSPFGVRE